MPTKTGFTKYTPEKIYELDGIYAADVNAIAQLKGFQAPLSEDQRSQVKEFAKKAKDSKLTINQAVQLASKAQQTTPSSHQQGGSAGDSMDAVTDEFSAQSVQQQAALMKQAVDEAVQQIVLGKVAKNLAIAQLEATGWDLSDRPDLKALLDQSEVIRQRVEAVSPTLLSIGQMMAISLASVPALAGKLPALPPAAISSGGSYGGTLPAAY